MGPEDTAPFRWWFAPVGTAPDDHAEWTEMSEAGRFEFTPTAPAVPAPAWASGHMSWTAELTATGSRNLALFAAIEHERRVALLAALGLPADAMVQIAEAVTSTPATFDQLAELMARSNQAQAFDADGLGRVLRPRTRHLDTTAWWPSPCRVGNRPRRS